MRTAAAILLLAAALAVPAGAQQTAIDAATAGRFAKLALDCVHREYPNKISHVLASDQDALPPRELTPAFFGCFDWHSSVHGHWLLARLARVLPQAPFTPAARAALARSLTAERLGGEVDYFEGAGRLPFERPYGLAWLLQLAAELRDWDDEEAQLWAFSLGPLERQASKRLADWLPKLDHPIRTGEHSQTAFAFGLILDWARSVPEADMAALIEERSRAFYLDDRDCPISYEPSGQDFLSPCLAEADLMRRILAPPTFAAWLGAFLPDLPLDGSATWLEPVVVSDRTDGKLAHLDGLNLSRAWMLEGIAAGLPSADPRRPTMLATAARHRSAGLHSVTGEHYTGGHWLGSFATYLLTGRGLPQRGGSE